MCSFILFFRAGLKYKSKPPLPWIAELSTTTFPISDPIHRTRSGGSAASCTTKPSAIHLSVVTDKLCSANLRSSSGVCDSTQKDMPDQASQSSVNWSSVMPALSFCDLLSAFCHSMCPHNCNNVHNRNSHDTEMIRTSSAPNFHLNSLS